MTILPNQIEKSFFFRQAEFDFFGIIRKQSKKSKSAFFGENETKAIKRLEI